MMTGAPPQIHPEGRYSAKEASALLGINRRTLTRWVAAGKIQQRFSRTTTLPRYRGRDLLALWRAEI